MPLILLNKPYRVLSQFRDADGRGVLADYVREPGVYPAGRLDHDSEGLLLLTDDGRLQAQITSPRFKLDKHYWAQVEGEVTPRQLETLLQGVSLKDGKAVAVNAAQIGEPEGLWPRDPPIRFRRNRATSWIALAITEGRNRQVRRMTAAVGLPTLRLVRNRVGPWTLCNLGPGETRRIDLAAARRELAGYAPLAR